MSEPPPIQRPANARARSDVDQAVPRSPDRAESEGIERAQARLVELGGATRAEDPALRAMLLEWPGRGPAFNHATSLRWSVDDWRDVASDVAARFRAIGEAPCLVVCDGLATPPDLAARLRQDGWLEIGHEIVMWTRRAAAVPHLDGPLRLESVTPTRVDEYEAVERRIFGISEREAADRRKALASTISGGRVRVYLVREAGVPVATARLMVEDGLAAIHGLGVVPERRRRGLGAYLTTIVTRAGLALGATLVWLSVDPENLPASALYEGLDYRPDFSWRRFLKIG
ncbi:MAG: GNAT family N-acetyltransferase [Candidatus Limnocylindrales bacterium]